MNRVILIGRLTNDPKIASTENGLQVTNFTLAVNRTYKNKDGNYDADFINCVAFKNTAEFIGKYFKKGYQVSIEGRLQTRVYEKDNKKTYITEVLTKNVELLERKKEEVLKSKTTYDDKKSDIELTDEDLKVFDGEQLKLPF